MKVKAVVIIESDDLIVQDKLNFGLSREEIIQSIKSEIQSSIGRDCKLISDIDDVRVEELK